MEIFYCFWRASCPGPSHMQHALSYAHTPREKSCPHTQQTWNVCNYTFLVKEISVEVSLRGPADYNPYMGKVGRAGGPGRPVGGAGWAKIDFWQTSFLRVWQRNFVVRSQSGSARVRKDSVHLTFNEFLHIKFSSGYIKVPRVMKV